LINIACKISHVEAIKQSTASSSPPIFQFLWEKLKMQVRRRRCHQKWGTLVITDNECPCNRHHGSHGFS